MTLFWLARIVLRNVFYAIDNENQIKIEIEHYVVQR